MSNVFECNTFLYPRWKLKQPSALSPDMERMGEQRATGPKSLPLHKHTTFPFCRFFWKPETWQNLHTALSHTSVMLQRPRLDRTVSPAPGLVNPEHSLLQWPSPANQGDQAQWQASTAYPPLQTLTLPTAPHQLPGLHSRTLSPTIWCFRTERGNNVMTHRWRCWLCTGWRRDGDVWSMTCTRKGEACVLIEKIIDVIFLHIA